MYSSKSIEVISSRKNVLMKQYLNLYVIWNETRGCVLYADKRFSSKWLMVTIYNQCRIETLENRQEWSNCIQN